MLGNFVTFEEQNKTGSNNERAQYSFGEKFIRQLKGVVCARCERQVVSARGAGNEAAAHKILKTDKRRATHQLLRISFLAEKRKKEEKPSPRRVVCAVYTLADVVVSGTKTKKAHRSRAGPRWDRLLHFPIRRRLKLPIDWEATHCLLGI